MIDSTNMPPTILLLDADCFKYIFAWHHQNTPLERADELKRDINIRVRELCTMAGVDSYIGIFGTTPTFRIERYKFKEYKGNREPKKDFVIKWESIIEDYCLNTLGFIKVEGMEADDAIGYLMRKSKKYCCASPDKDMLQLPGWHLQWRDKESSDGLDRLAGTLMNISNLESARTFWLQMLTGDASDNVAGIPGIGPKKALEKLKPSFDDPIQMGIDVAAAYDAAFGSYYGPIIFQETTVALEMGNALYVEHLLREQFGQNIIVRPLSTIPESDSGFHVPFPDFEFE